MNVDQCAKVFIRRHKALEVSWGKTRPYKMCNEKGSIQDAAKDGFVVQVFLETLSDDPRYGEIIKDLHDDRATMKDFEYPKSVSGAVRLLKKKEKLQQRRPVSGRNFGQLEVAEEEDQDDEESANSESNSGFGGLQHLAADAFSGRRH